ncbi:MAG: protein-L-isoaspartate(D-aspartate) O-methyltransferase [Sulfuricellaceae bacterium]|nr:protein-L-isoaspartate(D-aspartate) O-methyltransferase [Sulfuricellaceae bacterium]
MTYFRPEAHTDDFNWQRRQMLEEIADEAAETAAYTGRSAFSHRVMAAIGKVDRRLFVPDDLLNFAYRNQPLPIGKGQTISQPYIVALMTDLLDLDENDRVLEVGTGSGYQTAVLAELAHQVYSIEVVEPLAVQARTRLQSLNYANIELKVGNGWHGWVEHAPYDAIIVTAAPEVIPEALIQQLRLGGKIVIPLGPTHGGQELVLVEKQANLTLALRHILPVSFVPFTSDH